MLFPMDVYAIPNVARRVPPFAEMLVNVMDFLAIWTLTAILLLYAFIIFLLEGPFMLIFFFLLMCSIYL